MKKAGFVTLLIALLVIVLTLPSFATTYAAESLIIDKIDLLTDTEEHNLMARMTEFVDKTGCHIMFITDTVRYDSYNIPAELNNRQSEDLVLLTVSYVNGEYFYYPYTYGKAYSRISDNDIDTILDANAVYNNLKRGNTYEGLLAFIEKTQPRAMIFAIKTESIVPTIAVSIIIAAIVCAIVAARYKMKIKPTNYPLDKFAKLQLTEERDIFTGSFVTRRRISSSSGGGRSGGRSGGGRGGR